MKPVNKKIGVIASFIAVVLMGYFIGVSRLSSGNAPQKFSDARMRGAAISDEIVSLSNDIAKDLRKVSEYDQNGDFRNALDATTQLIQKTAEVKVKAGELSEELEIMAGAISEIKSGEAQEAAMDSITKRMALISRLLSYAEYLTQLSDTLRHHFTETPSNQNVGMIIVQINSEISSINSFNDQARVAMERFDNLLK